ncbi:MAG: cardiolipin synthase [Bacillota bacterium]|nr:cardiolipin synthase [Bacillota bacterium]
MYIFIGLVLFITLTQLIFLGTVIFLENRDPSKTIAWLLVLGILPLFGALFYFIFGRGSRKYRLQQKRASQKRFLYMLKNFPGNFKTVNLSTDAPFPYKDKLVRLLFNNNFTPLTSNNRTEVLTNGEETFNTLFKELETAKEHIHLEYFIFKDDGIGQELLKILLQKAKTGVKVRILLDGLGSRTHTERFKKLRRSGIEIEWFYPVRFPFLSSRLNLRNHRKIVVIDGRVAFLGGLNVGDEYISKNKRFGFWRDDFLKLEGEAVHVLQMVFLNDWNSVTKQEIGDKSHYPKPKQVGYQLIQIAATGPDAEWESALLIYFSALSSAEKKIYLATPYFIPDESTNMVLKTAALSGLDVRILFQGTPDHKITYWASHSYFEELLEVGVKIYRYKKGLLHAKILILDGEIGALGSTNFDIRSFSLNYEITAFVYDHHFAERLESDFYKDLNDSQEIILEDYVKRPLSYRFKESWARLFSPLL